VKQDIPADVVLSVTKLRPDEKLLLEALRARGLTVSVALRRDIGDLLNGAAPPPGVVLVRNLSHRDAASTAHRLEQLGVATLNTTTAIDLCHDKGKQALLFQSHGVPHPRSFHGFDRSQIRELLETIGWPVVVKPLSASWGSGVVRLADEACFEAWVGGCEGIDANGRMFPVLVQEYVAKPGYDLRVVVVGDEPVVAIRRRSDDWRTNTHLGARVERTELTAEMRLLCARAVDLFGPGFYGIDLVEDTRADGLMVLEVNANPEFARSSVQHGVDVAGRVADLLCQRTAERAVA
jgi:[lysine-biosynthesis-protein LysW]--L-2-aminoadipate ligase